MTDSVESLKVNIARLSAENAQLKREQRNTITNAVKTRLDRARKKHAHEIDRLNAKLQRSEQTIDGLITALHATKDK